MENKKDLDDWFEITKIDYITEIRLPSINNHRDGPDPVTNPGTGITIPEPAKIFYIFLFAFILIFRRKRQEH